VAEIVKATGFSRAYINRFFQQLRREGKAILLGRANQARYVAASKKNLKEEKKKILSVKRFLPNINLSEDKVLDEIQSKSGIFYGLSKNVSDMLDYTFTEMLNNAIEHSLSKKIEVRIKKENSQIEFKIRDWGVGIFMNIMKKMGLRNELEAIQNLLKGKQTTAPAEHTGEGIFFTSKVADFLVIKGSRKKLIFDNILRDIFIKDIKPIVGTEIEFRISANSKRSLTGVFKEYSGKTFEFSKTRVVAKLYKMDTDFFSRSQARRILGGLDKFKTIVLDFREVDTVGQAFADEVFRVWQNRHPNILIEYQNANENIDFMIKRSLAGKIW